MNPHRLLRPLVSLPLLIAALLASSTADAEELLADPPQAVLRGQLDRLQLTVGRRTTEQQVVDHTRKAHYHSLTPGVVTVDQLGRVGPVTSGQGRIHIRHEGLSAEVSIEVRQAHS